MHVKCEIMRTLVFDIYRRESKQAGKWEDLETSMANMQNSVAMHRSTVAKKQDLQRVYESRQKDAVMSTRNTTPNDDDPFEEI